MSFDDDFNTFSIAASKDFLKYIKRYDIVNKLGRFIGAGSEGVVYGYGKNRIIKILSVPARDYKAVTKTLDWLIKEKPSYVSRVYSYSHLCEAKSKVPLYSKKTTFTSHIMYYTAERLVDCFVDGHTEQELHKLCKKDGLPTDDVYYCNIMRSRNGVYKVCDIGRYFTRHVYNTC